MASMSYDAAMLLIHTLRQNDFKAPAHRLPPNFSLSGVTGELSFDAEGNRKVVLELLYGHNHRFERIDKPD
jgi:ABC-type branched-subunit amino acid transport system substrate-binding protein